MGHDDMLNRLRRQTYLVGSQLKGDSTSEGYIRALQQGCRSVERESAPRPFRKRRIAEV